eukprot:IDg1955t1
MEGKKAYAILMSEFRTLAELGSKVQQELKTKLTRLKICEALLEAAQKCTGNEFDPNKVSHFSERTLTGDIAEVSKKNNPRNVIQHIMSKHKLAGDSIPKIQDLSAAALNHEDRLKGMGDLSLELRRETKRAKRILNVTRLQIMRLSTATGKKQELEALSHEQLLMFIRILKYHLSVLDL